MALLPENQRDQIMVIVCVAALGLGYVYYEYMHAPRAEELTVLRTRVDSLEASNEQVRREVARGTAAKLREEAEQYGRLLTVMRQLVPVANEVPTLLDQISSAAKAVGLDPGEIAPVSQTPGEVFDTYKYRITVTGTYHRIAKFLDNIGSLTRIVAPMNLQINATSRTGRLAGPRERILDASFEIQTYVLKTPPSGGAQGR